MKTTVYTRVALLALALAAGSPTAFAQTVPAPASTPATPTAPASKHGADSTLTADERAHLDKVRTEALAANPDLQTAVDSLKAQHKALKAQGDAASADAKQALKAQKKQNEEQLQTAMLKIDPTVAPILAKIKAAHKENKSA